MNNLAYLTTYDYWLAPNSGTPMESWYLYLSAGILLLVIVVRVFLFFKGGRLEIYRKFDQIWFWGFFSSGLSGIFIWFSRTQSLQIFSTRVLSYSWVLANFVLVGYLAYYLIKIIPKKKVEFFEKKRKGKYLRR